MTAGRRLVAYLALVLAVLAALEGVVRAWEPLFAAASHRVLAKAATLDRRGPVQVLFFGSSRTWDGVSPRAFADTVASLRPGARLEGFNLASTATSLEALEYLAHRFARRPGLRLAVIELSQPQLESLGPPPWMRTRDEARDAESRLAAWLADHARLCEHRSFLVGENLARLPGLLFFAPRLDGSEVQFVEQLAALVTQDSSSARPPNWPPGRPEPSGAADAALVSRVAAVAALLRAGGSEVVFAVPPLSRAHPGMERTPAMQRVFAAIAAATGARVWDYAALDLDDALFRGTSHLTHAGRALYSAALAAQAVQSGLVDALVAGAL